MNQQAGRSHHLPAPARTAGTHLFRLLAAVALAAALPIGSAAVPVNAPPASQPATTPEAVAREALMEVLAPALAIRGATAVVTFEAPDARRTLAPCRQLAGFLPPGLRLSGRTLVGIRCLEGADWQTFLTANIRVEASTWQATHALRAGDPLAAGDVVLASSVLTAADLESAVRGGATQPNIASLASLDGRSPPPVGRIVQRPVAKGRALTASDVRDEGRVNSGDPVRVVYRGDGFAVTSEGRSVGAGDPGATISIRLASGALVNGTVKADHLVELPR